MSTVARTKINRWNSQGIGCQSLKFVHILQPFRNDLFLTSICAALPGFLQKALPFIRYLLLIPLPLPPEFFGTKI